LVLHPLAPEELARLAAKAGGVEALLSRKSPKYKEYAGRVTVPDDWLVFMAEEPRLIRRPILERDTDVLIGFDPDEWQRRLL